MARKFPLANVGLSLDKLLPWNWDACAGEGKGRYRMGQRTENLKGGLRLSGEFVGRLWSVDIKCHCSSSVAQTVNLRSFVVHVVISI